MDGIYDENIILTTQDLRTCRYCAKGTQSNFLDRVTTGGASCVMACPGQLLRFVMNWKEHFIKRRWNANGATANVKNMRLLDTTRPIFSAAFEFSEVS